MSQNPPETPGPHRSEGGYTPPTSGELSSPDGPGPSTGSGNAPSTGSGNAPSTGSGNGDPSPGYGQYTPPPDPPTPPSHSYPQSGYSDPSQPYGGHPGYGDPSQQYGGNQPGYPDPTQQPYGQPGYPPQPSYPPQQYGQPGYPQPQYGAIGAPVSESDEKTWAIISHISIPFFGFVGPLIAYLLYKDRSPWLKQESTEALNFSILFTIVQFAGAILSFITFGLINVVGWIVALIFCIIAAIAASKHQAYRYPVNTRIIK